MQPSERHLLLTQLLADINRIILGARAADRAAFGAHWIQRVHLFG